jgi:hypothetical protein
MRATIVYALDPWDTVTAQHIPAKFLDGRMVEPERVRLLATCPEGVLDLTMDTGQAIAARAALTNALAPRECDEGDSVRPAGSEASK